MESSEINTSEVSKSNTDRTTNTNINPNENTTIDEQSLLPTRFEVELEFVQSLANIPYVTYLLTQQTALWKSPTFKNYLKYLEYWCQPPYIQCIVYPNSLYILKLINGFLEKNAVINDDGLLDGIDELPRFLQLHGGQIMNEMVERWA